MCLVIDGRPETEEDRFVSQRPKLVAVDRSDQQVDGVRPEVDRRPDGRSLGHAPSSGSLDGADCPSFDGVTLIGASSAVVALAASDSAAGVSGAGGDTGGTGDGSGGGGGLTGRTAGSGAESGCGGDVGFGAGVDDGVER